jgi:hemerythrin-like domain-containing protein
MTASLPAEPGPPETMRPRHSKPGGNKVRSMKRANNLVLLLAAALLGTVVWTGSAWTQNGDRFLNALEEDHERVMQILEQLEQEPNLPPERKSQLWTELKQNLIPHARAEEATLYARMKEQGGEAQKMALRAKEEHRTARFVASRIDRMDPRDPRWDAKIYVLKELISHHVEEEEGKFWDTVEESFDDQELQAILDEFEALKKEFMATM